jgi:DeoR/GlpR family transcriptional regulator of sugar metabolism
VLQQSSGGWVQDLIVKCIADVLAARNVPDRQRDPFADHWDVTGLKERPGCLLEVLKVRGHFCGIVVGAGPVRTCDQDHQWFGGHGLFVLSIEECDTILEPFQVVLNASKWLGCCQERLISARKDYMQFRAKSRKNVQACKVCNVLTSQRKKLILERLRRDGQIIAKNLSNELELSEDTIRRDLRELAAEGLLQRVHGGALPASPAIADLSARQKIGADGKTAIGRAAAKMIQPGQIVILDGGTTAVQLARHLPLELKATIITHSPSIAVELEHHAQLEVILLGGRLFKHSMVAVGAATIAAIAQIRADTYFMGATGIHPTVGLTTGDLEEAHVKRALMNSAAETTALASIEKLNAASAYQIAPLEELSGIITTRDVTDDVTKPFEKLGVTVTRA